MIYRLILLLLGSALVGSAAAQPYELVIANGRVMDPETGLNAIRHVGITDGTIQAVSSTPLAGREVVDAIGLVVAPGFIDVNVASENWHANAVRVLDGVTAVLVMESAPAKVERWYEEHRENAVLHYGTAVGFWEARLDVMGDTTLEGTEQWAQMEHARATPEQIEAVLQRLGEGLSRGAVGIGVPLEYIPAATQAELLDVFRLAARHGAPAHIHMRGWGYDDKHIRSYGDLYEVFGGAIATGANLHILHINSSYNDWTPIGLELIARAQAQGLPVTTDMYPYAFGACPSG